MDKIQIKNIFKMIDDVDVWLGERRSRWLTLTSVWENRIVLSIVIPFDGVHPQQCRVLPCRRTHCQMNRQNTIKIICAIVILSLPTEKCECNALLIA